MKTDIYVKKENRKEKKAVETSCNKLSFETSALGALRNYVVLFSQTLTGRSVSEWGLGGNAGSGIYDGGEIFINCRKEEWWSST